LGYEVFSQIFISHLTRQQLELGMRSLFCFNHGLNNVVVEARKHCSIQILEGRRGVNKLPLRVAFDDEYTFFREFLFVS
jgi:hypothetical protein